MGTLNIPNSFTAGTKAKASEVNANFTAITDVVNGNLDSNNVKVSSNFSWTGTNTFTQSSTLSMTVSTTTTKALDVVMSSLTTSNGARFYSNSSDSNSRYVVEVHDDHASSGASGLLVRIDNANGNVADFNYNGTDVFSIGYLGDVSITSSSTTGNAFSVTASSLTTGNGLYVYSNDSDASTRNLGYFFDDNPSSVATTLKIRSDSSDSNTKLLDIDVSGTSILTLAKGGAFNFTPSGSGGVYSSWSSTTMTTGTLSKVSCDSLTTGILHHIYTNSGASLISDGIFSIHSDNPSAGDHCTFTVRKDTITPKGIAQFKAAGTITFAVHSSGAHVSTLPFYGPAGSASAPTYSGSSYTNYGMYFGTNILAFSVAGTQAFKYETMFQVSNSTSSTVPHYSGAGDIDSGYGFSAANTLALICGGSNIASISSSGILLNVSGSAATPSVGVGSGTGLYLSTTNTIGFGCGGSSVGTWDGTTFSISTDLDVSGDLVTGGIIDSDATTQFMRLLGTSYAVFGTNAFSPALAFASSYNQGTTSQRWGNIYCVSVDESSDETLKDIESIIGHEESNQFISSLEPFYYRMKDDKDYLRFGFTAQRTRSVIHSMYGDVKTKMVSGERDGEMGMSYTELIAPMVSCMQGQLLKQDDFEKRISRLEERL